MSDNNLTVRPAKPGKHFSSLTLVFLLTAILLLSVTGTRYSDTAVVKANGAQSAKGEPPVIEAVPRHDIPPSKWERRALGLPKSEPYQASQNLQAFAPIK